MIHITSDLHFFHANIILYCNRPWITPDGQPNVAAMNEALIRNWNETVSPDETTYVLGDFGFGKLSKKPGSLGEIRNRLNGKIVLIRGNHDHKPGSWLKKTDEIHDSLLINEIFMVHVPPIGDNRPFCNPTVPNGTKVIVCGHVHDQWPHGMTINGLHVFNAGVEVRGYKPVTVQVLTPKDVTDAFSHGPTLRVP